MKKALALLLIVTVTCTKTNAQNWEAGFTAGRGMAIDFANTHSGSSDWEAGLSISRRINDIFRIKLVSTYFYLPDDQQYLPSHTLQNYLALQFDCGSIRNRWNIYVGAVVAPVTVWAHGYIEGPMGGPILVNSSNTYLYMGGSVEGAYQLNDRWVVAASIGLLFSRTNLDARLPEFKTPGLLSINYRFGYPNLVKHTYRLNQ